MFLYVSGLVLPLGAGLAGWCAQKGMYVNVPDAYADSRFESSFDRKLGFKTKSMLCMPIKNADRAVIGVICCMNKRSREQVTPEIMLAGTGVAVSGAAVAAVAPAEPARLTIAPACQIIESRRNFLLRFHIHLFIYLIVYTSNN